MAEIPCLPLKRVTDGPLFGAKPGTLSSLVNMELLPDGYAEARGGFDELKPSGGTGAGMISAGGHSDALQLSTSYGWVRSHDLSSGEYWVNLQLAAGGQQCFTKNATIAVGDEMYWGADEPFGGIGLSLSRAGAWVSITLAYKYWDGGTWSALTTSQTINFTVLRTFQQAHWAVPSGWAPVTIGDVASGHVNKYWMKIEITALNTPTVMPLAGLTRGYWSGMRELYAASQDPRTSAVNGILARYDQNGTTSEWYQVNLANSLRSSYASPTRLAEYRGRLFLVNGKDTKRWDGLNLLDAGITNSSGYINATNVVGGAMPAGIWRYYAALGDGPCQLTAGYSDRQYADPLYGIGQTYYIGQVTTAANERVQIEMTTGVIAASSSVFIYRTDDLTNFAVADRGDAPAYMIQSFRVESVAAPTTYEQNFGIAGNFYYDNSLNYIIGLREAKTFDVAPPGTGTSTSKPKYIAVYQNRLFLADEETIYWSDPFTPDVFSLKTTSGYIRLARQWGGRHMGIVEFSDQIVAFTEDQTWGITNVDLDVPQLYAIALGVGCIAPDSVAVGDGLLVWLARDGVYAWDGSPGGPQKISADFDQTFGKMAYETHGGSRGIINDRRYDVRLSDPGYASIGSAYRFSFASGQWSTLTPTGFSSTLFPLAAIHAPLGNSDAGYLHPLWGKVDYGTGAGQYRLFLGELTTQDNATPYSCSASMHFPLPPSKLFKPSRVVAYYDAPSGWGLPSISQTTANEIGSDVGTMNTNTVDTGDDYTLVTATPSAVSAGTSDLKFTISWTSAAGGTPNRQRFFGAILEGQAAGVRRGM